MKQARCVDLTEMGHALEEGAEGGWERRVSGCSSPW